MANPTVTAEKLEALLNQLRRFDGMLDSQFSTIEGAWSRLDEVWDGHAYDQFKSDWDDTRNMMKTYLGLASDYESFLQRRIEALRKLEG